MKQFCIFLLCAVSVPAFASEKINYPETTKDRMVLEYLGFGDQEAPNGDRLRYRAQMSYGLTDRIDVAISAYAEDQANTPGQFGGPSARVRYQFTKQSDDWWLGTGIQGRYIYATDGGPDQFLTRILLQRGEKKWLSTVNIGLGRSLGPERSTGLNTTIAGQVIYKYDPMISPGMEFFRTFGPFNDLDFNGQRSTEIGPIVTGTIPIAEKQDFAYIGGYYRGLTANAPEQSFKLQLNYVRQF